MSEPTLTEAGQPSEAVHGGEHVLSALEPFGVAEIFTLSGAHVFPIYDACVKREWPIYDVRHEQTATFAAEGLTKLLRRPAVSVLTAGPGVTNSVSAVSTAQANGSPLVVLGGRAAQAGWGRGALQEFDHVPILDPVCKVAMTSTATDEIARDVFDSVTQADRPHRGPVFVDLPLDVLFGMSPLGHLPDHADPLGRGADPDAVAAAISRLAQAQRPALLIGSDAYWSGQDAAIVAVAEQLRIPVFANGLGRGIVPADHELAFSRVRSNLRNEADVVAVVGTPLDFRVGFGNFGSADVIHVVDSDAMVALSAEPALTVAGQLGDTLLAWADYRGPVSDHEPWIARLVDLERSARAADESLLTADGPQILPTRVYGELRTVLDRDAVIVCDGGDFVSYAGKYVDSYVPGAWLDPGPFGCLGTGMGYAMAARIAHPDRQVVVLLGDGAAGFSLMDLDSLVRHRLPVVIVIGNNGIWGLEKHPMQMLYGYDVAADLQPGCRYDQVAVALGGGGELVTQADDIAAAVQRGFASGLPYVVNVLTDPSDAYPRSSNLA